MRVSYDRGDEKCVVKELQTWGPAGFGDRVGFSSRPRMIFTGRSVDALDEVRGAGGAGDVQPDGGRRDVSAVAIAAGWFSSLRRPGRKNKKNYQKQAKSAWDISGLSTTVSITYKRKKICSSITAQVSSITCACASIRN